MRLRFRTTRNCCPLIGDVPFDEWESGGVCWLLEVGMAVSGAMQNDVGAEGRGECRGGVRISGG